MASLMFAVYLTCLLAGNTALATYLKSCVRQEGGLISANAGDTVTVRCFYQCHVGVMFHWYKQTLGQKPKLMSNVYTGDKSGTFHDEFKDNLRFSLEIESDNCNLTITNVHIPDSATYYCAWSYRYSFEFAEGVTISVKGSGSNVPALVYQSVSGGIQPGSVTLNCTVQTGTCDGQHSVYWFKDSGETHPGIIYTHGDRNDQCERKPDTQTHTCVYNLPLKSLNISHAGTYYCAVASCGHILFGNGTKLDFEDQIHSSFLVYVLSGSVTFTTILCVLLSYLICKMRKANCSCSASSTTNAVGDTDNLHYAALNINQAKRSRRERNETLPECVYSGVKL